MENKDPAAFLTFQANLRTGNLPLVTQMQSSLGWLAQAVPLTATDTPDASPASPEPWAARPGLGYINTYPGFASSPSPPEF